MVRSIGRKLLWAYALLMLLAAVGYARYDQYVMDGDGTAFLDIAQDLNTHRAALAINGYWNPGYPAVLATAERLVHPTLWRELALVRFVNVGLFALAMAATVFFTTALTRARGRWRDKTAVTVPDGAMHLLGLGLLTLSLGRELPVAAPRSDTLLCALFLFAGGLVLRLRTSLRLWMYPLLGGVLGCAYLTKSFAFLPSVAVLLGLLLYGARHVRTRPATLFSALGAVLVFGVMAGPYIAAISRQLGHFSTGESARLNYAFFIDMTPRWHEWFHRDLGHAAGSFLHAETPLSPRPPVFSYAAHPFGTYPLWFDPAWWTLGIKPHFWLKGHVLRFTRNTALFFRFLLGRPEPFVLLAVLLAFGARWSRRQRSSTAQQVSPSASWAAFSWWWVPVVWGVLMLAIYFPIDLQDRYLTAPLFLVLLPLFALLTPFRHGRFPATAAHEEDTAPISPLFANALVLLFAGTALVQTATYLAERRRHIPAAEQHHAGFDPQIFTAAAGLQALGVVPGGKLACMGDQACYTDHYWARLAGAQILGEVETPDEANPLTVWNSLADKRIVTAPLARMGLSYIVALFPNSGPKPADWIQLGSSNFFAYSLQHPVSPQQVLNVAAVKATP